MASAPPYRKDITVTTCSLCERGVPFFFCLDCDIDMCKNCKTAHIRSIASRNHSVIRVPDYKNALTEKCMICEENRDAMFYCQDCDENLCEPCSIVHRRSKFSRAHCVLPIAKDEDAITNNVKLNCTVHPQDELFLVCKTCEKMVCFTCLKLETHKGHELEKLPEVADKYRNKLSGQGGLNNTPTFDAGTDNTLPPLNQFEVPSGDVTQSHEPHSCQPYNSNQNVAHDEGNKDEELIKVYLDAIQEGSEKSRNIRIMLLGDVRVGKTSFGKNLMEEPLDDIQSTNGIDILTAYMVIDLDNKEREKKGFGQEKKIALEKIGRAINSFKGLKNADLNKTSSRISSGESVIEDSILEETLHTEELMEHFIDDTAQIRHPKNKEEYEAAARVETEVQGGNKAYVSLWDFAGESTFYATHHVFLTDDAVYVILYDLHKCLLDEKGQFGTVIKWLESIAAYCDNIPPVLLIGTHFDQLKGSKEERFVKAEEIGTKLVDKICEMRINWSYLDFFCISNTNPDLEVFSQIWTSLLDAASYQSQWERQMPTKWLSLEHKLMDMRASGTNVLKFSEVCKLDRELESPIENIHILTEVLMFLHNAGFIVFIRDETISDSLDQIVIINPPWIVKAFRCIITSPKFRGTQIHWRQFEKTAKLSESLIKCAWRGEFIEYKNLLLNAMEVLGLITKQMDDDAINPKEKYCIVPSMLQEPNLGRISDAIKSHSLSSAFVFSFNDNIIPRHIFDKLLAKTISKFQPLLRDKDDCFRRGFGIFRIAERNLGFIIHCKGSAIKLTLEKVNGMFVEGEGCFIRECVSEWLRQIMVVAGLTKFWEKRIESLHCNWCIDPMDTYIPIAYIQNEPQPCCELSERSHLVTKTDLAPWIEKTEDISSHQHGDGAACSGNGRMKSPISALCGLTEDNVLPTQQVQNVLQMSHSFTQLHVHGPTIYQGPTQFGSNNAIVAKDKNDTIVKAICLDSDTDSEDD